MMLDVKGGLVCKKGYVLVLFELYIHFGCSYGRFGKCFADSVDRVL